MLAYLDSAGHGQQVRTPGQHSLWHPQIGALAELKVLAFLLLALNPEVAFNPSGPEARFRLGNPELACERCRVTDRWRAASGRAGVFMAQSKKSTGGFGTPKETVKEVTAFFKTRKPDDLDVDCPCGFGKPYSSCCMPYHQFEKSAETPEWLVRARFVAWKYRDIRYIVQTTSKSNGDLESARGSRVDFAKFLDKNEGYGDLRLDKLEVGEAKPGDSENEMILDMKAWATKRNFTSKEFTGNQTVQEETSIFRKNKKGKWFYKGYVGEEEDE